MSDLLKQALKNNTPEEEDEIDEGNIEEEAKDEMPEFADVQMPI